METTHYRYVMWQLINQIGLEDCRVWFLRNRNVEPNTGIEISGELLSVYENKPCHISYSIFVDNSISYHEVNLGSWHGDERHASPVYFTRGDGVWRDHHGQHLSKFDGALTISILQTPSTVMLALRRLNLEVGQTTQIQVIQFDAVRLQSKLETLKYTCLDRTESGGTYIHENLSSGVKTKFTTDADNLVVDYEGQFRRVWTDTEQA